MRTLVAIGLAALLATVAKAEPRDAPYDAWVAAPHGVNVRADASSDAKIVAVLWSGARVFVRDGSGQFVRIDGYGVAGYAYIDRAYIGEQQPVVQPQPAITINAFAQGQR